MTRASRRARWWAKAFTVVLLFLAGFLSLWAGAFAITFGTDNGVRILGVFGVLGSIALFSGGVWLISGRRRYRHLPAGD